VLSPSQLLKYWELEGDGNSFGRTWELPFFSSQQHRSFNFPSPPHPTHQVSLCFCSFSATPGCRLITSTAMIFLREYLQNHLRQCSEYSRVMSPNEEKARQTRGRSGRPWTMYCSFRDSSSFSVPDFQLFGESASSMSAYFIYLFIECILISGHFSLLCCTGKNGTKIMTMFLACTVQAVEPWDLCRLLFVRGLYFFLWSVQKRNKNGEILSIWCREKER